MSLLWAADARRRGVERFSRWPGRRADPQARDFLCGKVPPLAGFEVAQQQAADPDADDLHHRQAKALSSFADLAFSSLPQHHLEPGAFARAIQEVNLGRLGTITIFEHHATPPGG